jgi:hypothetical protein
MTRYPRRNGRFQPMAALLDTHTGYFANGETQMIKPILACVLLAGCTDMFTTTYSAPTATNATVTVATPNEDATSAVDNQVAIGNTCSNIAATRGSAVAQSGIDMLRSEGAFTETELALIASGSVARGMSEKGAICALGGNSITIKEVRTITAPGHVNKVFTFDNGTVLYTDNGVVTTVNL